MKFAYSDVDDIDLFVAGTMEESHSDSLLGAVFTCIVGDGFQRLKEGDRFYYENEEFPESRFSLDQLNAIRESVSMSRIICDNTDIKEIQPRAFRTEDVAGNGLVDCEDAKIPKLNLKIFKESGN